MALRLPGNPGIDNTAFLFFVLAAAFAFFITVRGDLPKWLGLFGLAGSAPGKPVTGAGTSGGTTGPSPAPLVSNLPALPAIPNFSGHN